MVWSKEIVHEKGWIECVGHERAYGPEFLAEKLLFVWICIIKPLRCVSIFSQRIFFLNDGCVSSGYVMPTQCTKKRAAAEGEKVICQRNSNKTSSTMKILEVISTSLLWVAMPMVLHFRLQLSWNTSRCSHRRDNQNSRIRVWWSHMFGGSSVLSIFADWTFVAYTHDTADILRQESWLPFWFCFFREQLTIATSFCSFYL